jgi:molybdate transport system ATP-binding protein
MNILRGTISAISSNNGSDAMVALRMGDESLLARVTCRSVAALGLAVGDDCHAIMKSVALAPADIN